MCGRRLSLVRWSTRDSTRRLPETTTKAPKKSTIPLPPAFMRGDVQAQRRTGGSMRYRVASIATLRRIRTAAGLPPPFGHPPHKCGGQGDCAYLRRFPYRFCVSGDCCARDDMGAKAQKKTQNAPFRRILRKKIFAYRCSIQSAERDFIFSSMETRALRSSSLRSWATKDSQHRKMRMISGRQSRAFSVGKT